MTEFLRKSPHYAVPVSQSSGTVLTYKHNQQNFDK